MNIAHHSQTYRPTVSGIFYCVGNKEAPLIGIHWPRKACLVGESNLSPVAGEWRQSETAEDAIVRQVQAEYGLSTSIKVTSLQHPRFVSQATLKQYHWLLVALNRRPSEIGKMTVPVISEDDKEVASFGWYGPGELEGALTLMHREKSYMFRAALRIAISLESDLRPFARRFG